MAKLVLDWKDEQEDSFALIGISCHQKDYRLCWELNKVLELELQKEEDILGPSEEISFSRYYYNNEDFLQDFYLLTNKIGKVFFAPELKQADYILQIYGIRNEYEMDEMVQKIISIDSVLTAFVFDTEKLKYGHPLFYTAVPKKKKEEHEDLLAAFRKKE
ncbi:MAG: hypothetical protein POELPBGB_01878 [Bacteroidia bacterium]|nr:hypothetical protein [Bacteroidia bacterium]